MHSRQSSYFSITLTWKKNDQPASNLVMGNCIQHLFPVQAAVPLPIQTTFNIPYTMPSWPSGQRFAEGSIFLGGLEVCQISAFTKVWSALEGGEDNLGATFFKPADIPAGFSMLGCYAQANNKPLFGWVLAARSKEAGDNNGDEAPLKKPEDYSLVWSSKSLKIKQNGIGYVWLPTPPQGYAAVGYLVTNSPEKPSVEDMRCVRADLTEPSEKENKILEVGKDISFHSTRPVTRGNQAPGVCVGTFTLELDSTNNSSKYPSLVCLRNQLSSSNSSSSMPNMKQIKELLKAYSPWIYFHPKENYLPSSISWFFNNGALLYREEEPSTPSSIDSTGSNLPQGGSNDGAYWLDLPADEVARDKLKKGDLQTAECYLHVKQMLGGTFTDLAIWVFYPFNGPGRAKVGIATVPLGKTGEHVGDWEHVTLRVSNFTGQLWRVYLSQHSGGTWFDASELEFLDGNKPVAYASLDGHAFYSKPGLVLQGDNKLQIGIRNDTERGVLGMDTVSRCVVISVDHLESVIEPPWLNYAREWGPKVTYEIGEELQKVESSISEGLKPSLEKLVKILPSELFGEEGPTGPKMKKNWIGDEI